MQKVNINATVRQGTGKGVARSLRKQGMIPGVVYHKGDAISIQLNEKEMTKFIKSTAGQQSLVTLDLGDGGSKLAILKDYQAEPVKGNILHIDFQEVSLTEKITITIPVSLVGEAVGVKRDGGVIQHGLRDISIECLPDKVIGHVDVDITDLAMGHSLHVSDINLGEDIKVVTDPHEMLVSITTPTVVVEAAPEAEEEEGAEKPAAAEEGAEPEVAKKGKKEEGE